MIVHTLGFEVDFHVVEDSLLVGQVIVVLMLAVSNQVVRGDVLFLLLILVVCFLASTQDLVLVAAALISGSAVPTEVRLRAVVS